MGKRTYADSAAGQSVLYDSKKYGKYGNSRKARTPYAKRRLAARSALARTIKTTILSMNEEKEKNYAHVTTDFFHDTPNSYVLNDATSNYWPAQGSGENQRVGDKIHITGYKLRFLLAQKGDRPNVNYRFIVVEAPRDYSYSYAASFKAVTNNAMLDEINTDRHKIISQEWLKPMTPITYGQAGGDEFSFTKQIWVPRKKLVSFGTNGGYDHDDRKLMLIIVCYDTLGTIITDNLVTAEWWQTLKYRDP